jgi:hypothetical protein
MAKPINFFLLTRPHPWEIILALINIAVVVIAYVFLIKAGLFVARNQLADNLPRVYTSAATEDMTPLDAKAFGQVLDTLGVKRSNTEERSVFVALDVNRDGLLQTSELFGAQGLQTSSSNWPFLQVVDSLYDSQRRKFYGQYLVGDGIVMVE